MVWGFCFRLRFCTNSIQLLLFGIGDENEEVHIQNKTRCKPKIISILIKRTTATEIRIGA